MASRSGASDRRRLTGRFVVPVADEPHAEARLNGQILLMRRRDRLGREPFHLVVDVHEQRHGAQHTRSRPCGSLSPSAAARRGRCPSVVLPTISCASIGLAGWKPPARTSRYSRSSSFALNMPLPPLAVIARSTTRLARLDAVVLGGDDLHRPRGAVVHAVRPVRGRSGRGAAHRLELERHLGEQVLDLGVVGHRSRHRQRGALAGRGDGQIARALGDGVVDRPEVQQRVGEDAPTNGSSAPAGTMRAM